MMACSIILWILGTLVFLGGILLPALDLAIETAFILFGIADGITMIVLGVWLILKNKENNEGSQLKQKNNVFSILLFILGGLAIVGGIIFPISILSLGWTVLLFGILNGIALIAMGFLIYINNK